MTEIKKLGLPTDEELEQMRTIHLKTKEKEIMTEMKFDDITTGWDASLLCKIITEKDNMIQCFYRDQMRSGGEKKNLYLFNELFITPNSLDGRRMLMYDQKESSIFIPLKSGSVCKWAKDSNKRSLVCTMGEYQVHPYDRIGGHFK